MEPEVVITADVINDFDNKKGVQDMLYVFFLIQQHGYALH
jgi:hypothetical protein